MLKLLDIFVSQLGSCFFSGDGVQRDLVKAASFFRRAAEQGDTWPGSG